MEILLQKLEYAKQLTSISFLMDSQGLISHPSEVLAKRLPELGRQPLSLFDFFLIERPKNLTNALAARKLVGRMVLMVAKNKRYAIRGIFQNSPTSDSLLFVGSPWLSWLEANQDTSELHISDFSPADPQLDSLVLLSTQKATLNDLNQLTRELTLAKQKETKARKTQAEFFAVMSHEMRTPLNGVIGALSLLVQNQDDIDIDEMLHIALSSSEFLAQVINNILDYSKLEVGGITISPQEFAHDQLLADTLNMFYPTAKMKGLNIQADAPPNLYLIADKNAIRQILNNLVSNAVKVSSEGEITVTASLNNTGDLLTYEIHDCGSGIPEQMKQYLFTPYWSKPYSTREYNTGTGLGLNISKRLAEMMGGSIGFENTPNGAKFWVKVPVETITPKHVNEPKTDNAVIQKFSGKVLIAEDNEINQLLIRNILSHRGLEVTIANTGSQALRICTHNNFDLILMDISMPDMNGMEATGHIRQLANHSQTPVIAFTAYASQTDQNEFLEAGMNGMLSKPVDFKSLDQCLTEWLPKTDNVFEKPQVKALHTLSSNTEVLLDKTTAHQLLSDIGVDVYIKVADMFKQELSSKLEDIEQCQKLQNYELMGKTAHSIHSTASSLGVLPLGKHLKKIEIACRHNTVDGIADNIVELKCLACKSLDKLENFCSTLRERPQPVEQPK